ncbi:MAG: coenzyme F420-0:L-glutamate ligase [Anaerolineales bacterium]|jgi:coenzyme F420-0:L-glutamate ligase/coenzyme F420-1:gamma-L-glutamate ligase|nr:coenzyme F420-0:L-glutamate ligase [Anaerolineales bacterium]
MSLTLTSLQHIPLIRHGDNLADILLNSLRETNMELQDNDILVIAQKIISKAEGRMVSLAGVEPSQRARELGLQTEKDPRLVELMLRESNEVVRFRKGVIVVEHKLGFICANAGIDHSNVAPLPEGLAVMDDWVLLLPENPDASAKKLREEINKKTGKTIGVMIIDSHGRAWRNGTVGICIGLSGIPAVVDERGWKDLFGYTLKATIVGVADELAAAASLVMGQAAEGTPAAHVRGFPYPLEEGSLQDLIRPKEMDMFR